MQFDQVSDLDDDVKKERSAVMARPCGKLATELYDGFRYAKLSQVAPSKA